MTTTSAQSCTSQLRRKSKKNHNNDTDDAQRERSARRPGDLSHVQQLIRRDGFGLPCSRVVSRVSFPSRLLRTTTTTRQEPYLFRKDWCPQSDGSKLLRRRSVLDFRSPTTVLTTTSGGREFLHRRSVSRFRLPKIGLNGPLTRHCKARCPTALTALTPGGTPHCPMSPT